MSWSLWGHGFVTFQEPDAAGMHYVLSYVLKDQFTPGKARETMRETKVENFATGLFRMSKRPAIGEQWLYEKFARLDDLGAVLPNLNMSVPGVNGFYHPSGSFRSKTLWALVALNLRAVWAMGRSSPQWPVLLASCSENHTDMEILNVTEKDPENYVCDERAFEREIVARSTEHRRKEFARNCGAELPCLGCLAWLTDDALASIGVRRDFVAENPDFTSLSGSSVYARQQPQKGRALVSNPFCERRGSKISRETFPDSDRTNLGRGL